MLKSIEVTGKTEEEAISSALRKLNIQREDITVEVLERAKSGFLRIGSAPAKIKVTFEVPDEEVAEPVVEKSTTEPAQRATSVRPNFEEKPVEKTADAPVNQEPVEDRTRKFLEGLLERMDVTADITIHSREDGGVAAELSGKGMGAVIGRRGETLDAIQHLANYCVNHGSENRVHISIDAENYRAKREESLVRLAEKMAEKALKYHRSMALEPMNSYERHVIHTALQDYEGVTTCSTGTEPNRRVVISCEKKPQE